MFCPLCDKWTKGNTTEKVMNHQNILLYQRKKYLENKKQIGEGDTETILITQDFTQLDLESGFIQDLIICCYWYNSNSKDGLERDYRHFVGQKGDKNDIRFVAGCWKQLLEEHWFNLASRVLIWSDGGPKHFKISANLKLFQAIQKQRSDIDWEYHFFPAYHGCNVCDTVASQAKKKMNEDSRNFHEPNNSPEKVMEKINHLVNHQAVSANISRITLISETLTNLTKYFKFTAPPDENNIYAFKNSYCEDPEVYWNITEHFDLEDF